MDLQILEEAGLTQGESKVYLALLKLGTTRTGPLSLKANVSSSKVYKILDRLERKGLVGHTIKAKTKHYTAMEPKRILDYLDEKEKQLEQKKKLVRNILPELELQQKLTKQKTEASVFQGFKAIANFYRNILDELKAGEEYHVLGAHYGIDAPGVRSFFYNYHSQRAKKKIKVKLLANYETKKIFVKTSRLYSQIKFLPEYLVPKMVIVFYKNKAFMFFLTTEPTGFLIESNEAVNSFKAYFDTLWKIAKK